MRRLILLLVVFVAACSSSSRATNPETTTTVAPGSGWNANALAFAQSLADKARAGGVECTGYSEVDYAVMSADLQKSGLSAPAAMTQCTSSGENLTFETFSNQGAAYAFMGSKIATICRTATSQMIPLKPFPYVAGTTWFVEPDTDATAKRLATLLRGVARDGRC